MKPRFFYLVPGESRHRLPGEGRLHHRLRILLKHSRQHPSGGAKIIYQHCEMLEGAGFSATPVHLERFRLDWFPHQCVAVGRKRAEQMLRSTDVLVCPEVIAHEAKTFDAGRKIVFVQGWSLVREQDFQALGFEQVLTVSRFCLDFMQAATPLPCHCVTNGIDLSRFVPAPEVRVENRLLFLARKRPELAREVMERLLPSTREAIKFVGLENTLSQAEMIENYQKADLFMTLSYPEGFGLPPLEAMACGCAVVGFTGGGGSEHMIDGVSAAVAEDGDLPEVVAKIERLVCDEDYRETIRAGGMKKAREFGLDRMRHELVQFAHRLSS